jgi:hypothetical protein
VSADKLPAGRELDALVSEKVMGRQWFTFIHQSYLLEPQVAEHICFHGSSWTKGKTADWDSESQILTNLRFQRVPDYSTDIAAAWEVVEKLGLLKTSRLTQDNPDEWVVETKEHDPLDIASGETAPLAICRAALKAVGL